MSSITTDGVKVFTVKCGIIKLLKNTVKAEHPDSDTMSFHCTLHQKSLCKAAQHVIDFVVSVVL